MPLGGEGALGAGTPPGRIPALPGAQLPASRPGSNIGSLFPAISPSPAPFSPAQVRHVAYGRADSVTMGPGPVVTQSGTAMLAAVAAAIVIAATGGWLSIVRRLRKRRAP